MSQAKRDYKAEFLMQLRVARLPVPECEVLFAAPRKWRFDFAYPAHKLAIEYQGGIYHSQRLGHSTTSGLERDCEKFSEAAARGWRLILINAGLVRSGKALQFVERALKV